VCRRYACRNPGSGTYRACIPRNAELLRAVARCDVAVPCVGWIARCRVPKPSRLVFDTTLRELLKAIFFGLLFFWASKRKVTRPPAGGRNARCVSGPIAEDRRSGDSARTTNRGAGPRPTPGRRVGASPCPSPRKSDGVRNTIRSPSGESQHKRQKPNPRPARQPSVSRHPPVTTKLRHASRKRRHPAATPPNPVISTLPIDGMPFATEGHAPPFRVAHY